MPPPVNAKKWVEANRSIFQRLTGQRVSIKLNAMTIATDTTLQAMIPTKITELENAPEKRVGADGKQYTPPCYTLVFDQGRLVFAIEDTMMLVTAREGVKLVCGDAKVIIEAVDEDYHFA